MSLALEVARPDEVRSCGQRPRQRIDTGARVFRRSRQTRGIIPSGFGEMHRTRRCVAPSVGVVVLGHTSVVTGRTWLHVQRHLRGVAGSLLTVAVLAGVTGVGLIVSIAGASGASPAAASGAPGYGWQTEKTYTPTQKGLHLHLLALALSIALPSPRITRCRRGHDGRGNELDTAAAACRCEPAFDLVSVDRHSAQR